MDDRNTPSDDGTAELSLDAAVSMLTADSAEEAEQTAEANETEAPKAAEEDATDEVEEDDAEEGAAEDVDDDASDQSDDDALEIDLETVFEIDGEEVSLKELRDGALRQSDYTRKSQELAQKAQAIEAERQAIADERARYAQALEQMRSQVEAVDEREPNWDELFDRDPLEYMRLDREWRQKKEQRANLVQEHERVRQLQHNESLRQREAELTRGKSELLEKIPEWKNPEVAAKEAKEISQFLLDRGYPAEAVSQISVTDVLFAREAMRAMRATSKVEVAKKKVANKPRVIKAKASAPKSQGQKARIRNQMAKLERTGDIEDALPLLMN